MANVYEFRGRWDGRDAVGPDEGGERCEDGKIGWCLEYGICVWCGG